MFAKVRRVRIAAAASLGAMRATSTRRASALHAFGNARSARRLARCQEPVERQLYARSATLDRPPTQPVDVARAQKKERTGI